VRSYWTARHGPLFSRLGDYFENPASWSAAVVEHAAVLDAIRKRDATAAREAMQQHLKKATGRYSASWRRANHS
jgi:DNA-binding GntR family transcriptional regulator